MLTAPITTTKVANELQTSSHDVGTLCTSSNINMYSKNKPVSYATSAGITDTERKSVNYGVTVPTKWSGEATTRKNWIYNKPTGGSSSPYRLGDFRNYNHGAVPCVRVELPEEFKTNESPYENYVFTVVINFNNAASNQFDQYSLSLQDLYQTHLNTYPTLVIEYATRQYVTSTESTLQQYINAGQTTIPISVNIADTPLYNQPEGTIVKVGVILSETQYTNADSYSGQAYSLDNPTYSAVKQYSLIVVAWLEGVSWTGVYQYQNTTGSGNRYLALTNAEMTITVPSDWIRQSIYLRFRAEVASSTGQQAQWITNQIYIDKEEFANSNTYTFTLPSIFTEFTVPQTSRGNFVLYAMASNRSLTDEQWETLSEPFGSQTITTF